MGLHNCSFCAANDPHSSELPASSSNLFIPGNSVVFVAPGRIDHYIEAHSYLPPKQFITAVLPCPDLHSDEYREALRVSCRCRGTSLGIPHAPSNTSLKLTAAGFSRASSRARGVAW
jgi:hypothetical protein